MGYYQTLVHFCQNLLIRRFCTILFCQICLNSCPHIFRSIIAGKNVLPHTNIKVFPAFRYLNMNAAVIDSKGERHSIKDIIIASEQIRRPAFKYQRNAVALHTGKGIAVNSRQTIWNYYFLQIFRLGKSTRSNIIQISSG